MFVASAEPPVAPPAHFVPPPPNLPDNCDDAVLEYRELVASGKGPKHPAVLAAKIVNDACNADSPPPGMLRHRASPPPLTCGAAALQRAELVALGKGPNHPAVLLVEERLRNCANATPSAEECLAVAREHAELATRYGPRHPSMIASDAKRALCP